MDLDIATFRAAFPAYSDDVRYPDSLLEMKFSAGKCYIEDSNCAFDEQCRQYAYQLLLAHMLHIADQVADGGAGRAVSSASEGPVSVSFSDAPDNNNFTHWLQNSPYGVELAALISTQAIGDYYGGSYALYGLM